MSGELRIETHGLTRDLIRARGAALWEEFERLEKLVEARSTVDAAHPGTAPELGAAGTKSRVRPAGGDGK